MRSRRVPRIFTYQLCAVALLVALAALLVLPWGRLDSAAANWLWDHNHVSAAYYVNYADPTLAMEEGNYYFGGGTYDVVKAAKAYQLALRLQPGVLWGHYELGRIYFVEGKLDMATQELDAELAANPGNLRVLYERGLVETSQVNLDAAEADFDRFIAWAPREWAGYNDLAFVLAKEGKYAESEQTIDDAMQQVPNAQDIPWLWNSLGLAQLNELHYTQAQASFAKALPLAKGLTLQEWRWAYSANDPAADAVSIQNFQHAIEANLKTAQAGSTL